MDAPPEQEQTNGDAGAALHGVRQLTAAINIEQGGAIGSVTAENIVGGNLITEETAYTVAGLPNPYQGLASYTYATRTAFGGRDQQIERSVALLTTPGAERVVLFVTGASGSGKSSFAQAGVVPALERVYQAQGFAVRWAVARPGRHPLSALGRALSGLGVPAPADLDWTRLLRAPESFQQLLTSQTPRRQVNLLVLDQFEEVLTQAEPAESDAVWGLLGHLRSFEQMRTHLIVTLRADYLPSVIEVPGLSDLVTGNLIGLPAMTRRELLQAIERPLQAQNKELGTTKRLDPDLVDKLAEDVGNDPTLLPLLQVTLTALWDEPPHRLVLGRYRSLTAALEEKADHVLDNDAEGRPRPAGQSAALMAILLDLVDVSLDDEVRRDVRRTVPRQELIGAHPEREPLIEELVNARLLATSVQQHGETDTVLVDIIHESLLRKWSRLCTAIAAERDTLERRARFRQAMRDWLENGEAEEYLLEGVRLAEARELDRGRDTVLQDPAARRFFESSRERQEAEQQRELAQARALAEAQRARAEESARAARRLRTLLAVVVGVGLLALGLAAVAWVARDRALAAEDRATHQAQINAAHATALEAEAQLPNNPELSILLAREALGEAPTEPRAADVLRHAMVGSPARLAVSEPGGAVRALVFSPDGGSFATGGGNGTAHIWDSRTGVALAELRGHSGRIWAMSYSHDGSRLVTASADGTARLWEAPSGRPIADLPSDAQSVTAVSFSPDGQTVATAASDGRTRVWDTNGQRVLQLLGPPGVIQAISYSQDSRRLLTAGPDQTASIWDLQRAQPVAELSGHPGAVSGASFDRPGRHVLTVSGALARVWDVEAGSRLVDLPHPSEVRTAVFSPEGNSVLTASADGVARVWDATTGQVLAEVRGQSNEISMAAFSADGKLLLTGGADGLARVWDAQTGTLGAELRGHGAGLSKGAFSPDASLVATADSLGQVRLWRVAADRDAFSPGRHAGPAFAAAFSPDGACLATGGLDSTVRIWRLAEGCESSVWTVRDGVTSLAFERGGRLAVAYADGSASILDGRTGQTLLDLQGRAPTMYTIRFSPDGRRLVTAGGDAAAQVWDAQTGQQVGALPGHEGDQVTSAAFAGDGRSIATGEADGTARVWDAESLAPRTDLRSDQGVVHHLAFAPGRPTILVTAGNDGTVRVWATETSTQVARLPAHGTRAVRGVTFSSDGRLLLTVGDDGAGVTWETSGWQRLADLRDPSGDALALVGGAFSPDTQRVATAGRSGRVVVYPVERFGSIAELLDLVPSRVTRRPPELDPGERASYVRAVGPTEPAQR